MLSSNSALPAQRAHYLDIVNISHCKLSLDYCTILNIRLSSRSKLQTSVGAECHSSVINRSLAKHTYESHSAVTPLATTKLLGLILWYWLLQRKPFMVHHNCKASSLPVLHHSSFAYLSKNFCRCHTTNVQNIQMFISDILCFGLHLNELHAQQG